MARITLNILIFVDVISGKAHPSYLEMLKVTWPELHWTFWFLNIIPGKNPSYLEMLKVPWPFTIYLSTTPLICWICKLHWFASLGVPKHINYWGRTCAHLFFLFFWKLQILQIELMNMPKCQPFWQLAKKLWMWTAGLHGFDSYPYIYIIYIHIMITNHRNSGTSEHMLHLADFT